MLTRLSLGFLVSVVATVTACGPQTSRFVDDAGAPDTGSTEPEETPDAEIITGDAAADTGTPDGPLTAVNLIPNGDFEKGNTLFQTDYTYATANTLEGQYTVGTNAQVFNGFLVTAGDHTSGTSKMFIGNGKAEPDRVWFTGKISVTAYTKYFFEAFVMNVCCTTAVGDGINPVGPSKLSFYANGQLLGTRTSAKLGEWEGLSTTWDSGSSTTVDLKLVNAETQGIGNDFAVDDVYLGTISTVLPPPK